MNIKQAIRKFKSQTFKGAFSISISVAGTRTSKKKVHLSLDQNGKVHWIHASGYKKGELQKGNCGIKGTEKVGKVEITYDWSAR